MMGAAELYTPLHVLDMPSVKDMLNPLHSKPSYYKTELTPKQRKARKRSKIAKKSRQINRRK